MKNYVRGFAVALAACSVPAAADFQIQYSEATPAAKGVLDQKPQSVVLLDKAYRSLTARGTAPTDEVAGSGTDVALPLALQMLLPSGWRVMGASPDIGRDAVVDWRDGEALVDVLERGAADNGLLFDVDWDKKQLTILPGQSKGSFGQMIAANVDAAKLTLPEPMTTPLASTDTSSTVKSSSPAVATPVPAPVTAPVPTPAPLPTVDVFRGDTVRVVARKLSEQLHHSRALLDFNNGSLANLVADTHATITLGDYSAIQRDLVRIYGAKMNAVQLRPATDPMSGTALVLTDRQYADPYRLRLFDVKPGSLRENAVELSKVFGWLVPERYGWQLAVDYSVRVGFPLVVSTLADGYEGLFKGYPVQAQLIEGNDSVIFVSRVLPVSER